MQGRKSSMGSFPNIITFDHNPTATDASTEQPVFWNNDIQNYNHNIAPEYITSTTNNGNIYLDSSSQAQNLSGWNMGESSSSNTQNYNIRSEQKIENEPDNAISVSGVDLNQTSTHLPYLPLFMQNASTSTTFSQNPNMSVEDEEHIGNINFGEEIYSTEGSRLSCKRKAIEGHIGQSSSSGIQPRANNDWNNIPGWYNNNFGSNTNSTLLETPIRGNTSETPLSLNVATNPESSRRSNRVRVNSSPQITPSPNLLSNRSISGDSTNLLFPQNNFLNNRTPQPSRWNRGSSSRNGYSLNFGEGTARPNLEPGSNNLERNNLDNPIFVPTNEAVRDSAQIRSGNLNINGNLSRNASTNGISQRTHPRYSRRLSEFVRRSVVSSPQNESGGQNSNLPIQNGSPSAGGGNYEDRLARIRSVLLERQLGSNSLRAAASNPEGRSRLVSEIRNVLDLMRRGEGLRLEDMVLFDQSVFFGMADIHDRHRDMRLDVDNMSYEELLALEERMGSVNTGLSEENILNHMKQRKFFSIAMGAQTELEPCCICREEYNDGEDIGTVECGHEFHSGCIKQWLMLKNSCPICKTAALSK